MIGFPLVEGRSQYILIGLEIRFKKERLLCLVCVLFLIFYSLTDFVRTGGD